MPSVTVPLIVLPVANKKARLVDVTGLTWTFQHAPPEVDHTGQALSYGIEDRPDRHPLVEEVGRGLHRMRLTWLQAFPDPRRSIESRLHDLKGLCRNGKLLRFDYGPAESGWWRVLDLSWTTKQRNRAGETTRATVTLEMARAISPDTGALVDRVLTR